MGKHFLQAPCTSFDLPLTLFETRNLQKTQKQNRKQPPKNSNSFLIEPPKRVLPKDSHYLLLGPINPFGQLWGLASPVSEYLAEMDVAFATCRPAS